CVPRRLRGWLRARMSAPERDAKQLAVAFGATLAAILLWAVLFDRLGATIQVVLACVVIAAAIVAVRRWPAIVVSGAASNAVPEATSEGTSDAASDVGPTAQSVRSSLRAKLDGY